MTKQDEQIAKLERQGWEFLNWCEDPMPDTEEESGRVAVMGKRTKHGTTYSEIEPDGTVTF